MFLEELTECLLKRCPSAGESVERKACSLAYSSWKKVTSKLNHICHSLLFWRWYYLRGYFKIRGSLTTTQGKAPNHCLKTRMNIPTKELARVCQSQVPLTSGLSPSSSHTHQHCLSSSLKLSGQLSGTGRCKLLLPTPQMIAEESTSL